MRPFRHRLLLIRQDADLRCTSIVCPGTTENLRVPPGAMLPELVERPEDGRRVQQFQRAVMQDRTPARRAFQITVGGEPRSLTFAVDPIRTGADVLGVRTVAVDRTSRRHHARALRQEMQRARVDHALAERTRQAAEAAREKAEAAQREAARLRKARTQFLAGVAHDLRSPLSVIDGSAELLKRTTETHREAPLDHILAAVDQLRSLASSLTEWLRFETGEVEVDVDALDVRPVVETATDSLRNRAAEAGIDLDVHLPPTAVSARAAPVELRRVVDNLVGNAITYSRTGDTVSVRLRSEADRVVLEVADTGPGMQPEVADTVFEPLVRGNTETDGSGLGLAVARRLTEAMGGSLRLETTPGEGATFTADLPPG